MFDYIAAAIIRDVVIVAVVVAIGFGLIGWVIGHYW